MKDKNTYQDKWIFDYLEGNLSDDERAAFESQLRSDPFLEEELNIWKTTFVSEPLPKIPWSQVLIRPARKNRWLLFMNSFTFGLVLFVISGSPTIECHFKPEEGSAFSKTSYVAHSSGAVVQDTFMLPVENKECTQEVVMADNGSSGEKINEPPYKLTAAIQQLSLKKMDLPVICTAELVPSLKLIVIPFKPGEKKSHSRQLTRKELRLIKRKKKKQYNLRLEKEFLKGNVPYVVPLDLEKF